MTSNEKRVSSRHRLDRRGWVVQSSSIVQVDVVDISAQGAKIVPPADCELPDKFDLLLTIDGKVGRCVKVAWRKDDALGLRFVGQYRPRAVPVDIDGDAAAAAQELKAAAEEAVT